jgi:hypothetical protein
MDKAEVIDLERLLKLRVVVARIGEMDLAQWWNTRGQLGPLGAAALRRGLPRTHHFAQARSVFAVAAHRCDEIFNPPGSVTLWRLPASTEEQFDARWEHWLDNARDWDDFFADVQRIDTPDVATTLKGFKLVSDQELEDIEPLSTTAEGRAVPLAEPYDGTDSSITRLALAFAKGRTGSLAVPYARRVDA